MSVRLDTYPELARLKAGKSHATLLLVVGLSLGAGSVLGEPRRVGLVLTASLVVLLVGLGVASPRSMLYALIVWLAALGLTRRLTSGLAPSGELDPLLVVGPAAMLVLVHRAALRGAFGRRSRLANAVLVLSLLLLAGALNPMQGTLTGGFAGLLLVLVPTAGFWIGRGLCDDSTLRRILGLVAVLACGASVYGLMQTFVSFPSWDARWISTSGYEALDVNGVTRAFSSFSSASEYALFLAIGLIVCATSGLLRKRALLTLPAVGLLATALFFESSRGIIVLSAATIALLLGVRLGIKIPVTIVIVALSLFVLTKGAAYVTPDATATGPGASLASHQAEGLADPFDSEKSTLPVHLKIAWRGLRSGFSEPLGLGVSSVTIAGSKFGGLSAATEMDPSNVAVAIGLPGLIVYLVMLAAAFRAAYSLASRRRDALSLASLGILGVSLFQWLNGGQYSVAFLVWLVLGWIDRSSAEPADRQ